MAFREWLKRLFERSQPVREDDVVDGRGYVTPVKHQTVDGGKMVEVFQRGKQKKQAAKKSNKKTKI